jgi:hypothetical protein
MFSSMQVDFSVSGQEAKVEGTAGQYMESGMFMVGSHQWRLHYYPTSMNDHQWMDVPDGIAIVLILVHKSQMVRVSLLV